MGHLRKGQRFGKGMKDYLLVQHPKRKATIHVMPADHIDVWDDLLWHYFIEDLLTDMEAWCKTTACGRRTAYDMFAFKTKKEMALFALKWS